MSTTTPHHIPIQIAVIVGSTREGRRAPLVAEWFVKQIADRSDVVVDVIDLAEIELPERLGFGSTPGLIDFRERLAAADAFLVVTPEYNHSYPAALKHAIDFAREQWWRKVVGFVSYGGVSGGLRAVEHLRQVFAEQHVHGVRETISFHGPWNGFSDDGLPADPAGCAAAATALVDDLVWWGRALRVARQADTVTAGAW